MQEKRGRGRPPTGLIRTTRLNIRTTPEEAEYIKNKAKEAGKNLTDYILDLIKK
ncbi:TPA: DUF1778 domain-containing protein [Streptococcus suis]